MTVRELRDKLDDLMEHHQDDEVSVTYRGGSPVRGYTPGVTIENLQVGFDWDNGRILLSTKDPLWGSGGLNRLELTIKQDLDTNKDSTDEFIKAHNHGLQRALFLINELKRG